MLKKNRASPPQSIATKSASKIANKIAIGMVTAAHGIQGWVKIKPFTAAPRDIVRYGEVTTADGTRHTLTLATPATLDATRHNPRHIIARLSGVSDRDEAEALANTTLYINRSQLPVDDDAWYHADLLGAVVYDSHGKAIGEAVGFYDFGAGELVEVALYTLYNYNCSDKGDTGDASEANKLGDKKVLLPFTHENRIAIDPAHRCITLAIDPLWLDQRLDETPNQNSQPKNKKGERKIKP